jgi:hypothetical protein
MRNERYKDGTGNFLTEPRSKKKRIERNGRNISEV